MANLNLSEFTEKLFVTDADHTFIWDSANAISKRVSRNSWLNSGTLTSDAPVTISQTWNNAAVVFTALKVNGTAISDPTSRVLDLQAGAASIFNVDRLGRLNFYNTDSTPAFAFALAQYTNTSLSITRSGVLRAVMGAAGYICSSTGVIGFSNGTDANAIDTILLRDGAPNTLALRNGAAAQTFNVYGSYGSISDYKRLSISCDQTTGNATITNQAAGYTAGTVSINGVPVGRGKVNLPYNIAIGTGALGTLTAGQANIAIGEFSLFSNTVASDHVSVGLSAFYNLTSGSGSVAIGNQAGRYFSGSGLFTVSNGSVYIGYGATAAANATTNEIAIGGSAVGIGSNSVVLGNDSITKTALKGNVGIGTTSPTSKLQVSAGDVEVDTIAKGVILKSPDGTRYRVTVANGGTLSVAAV